MIVKCITPNAHSLTLNKEYEVVAILMNDQGVRYNLVSDNMMLAYFKASLFEVTDNKLGDDFIYQPSEGGRVSILPESLSYLSFYEDFHNHEPIARAKFKARFPALVDTCYSFVDQVKYKQDFITFLQLLRNDLKAHEWENKTLPDFLEAMADWVGDMEGYYWVKKQPMPEDINWKCFADILMAATMYE